jgi:hypothetical protein
VSAENDLRAFIAGVSGFESWKHVDKIRMFAWLQHHLFKRERFVTGDINWCYDKLSYQPPNTTQYLKNMEGRELLKDAKGYRCEGKFRSQYDQKYGEHEITLNVRQMVKSLVDVIPEIGEKDIFQEALICLHHDAGRAAIVMVWNIALYHLCQYILKHRLDDFNNRVPVRYPKKWKVTDLPVITKYEDFSDNISEREIIEVANSAGIVTGDMFKIYKEKLDKRNSAAHPSTIHITQGIAEGFIEDLIRNTVLLLRI